MEEDNGVKNALPPEVALHDNPDAPCPEGILKNLSVVSVEYYSVDGTVRPGQIVVHRDLAGDVAEFFKKAKAKKFPIQSVTPVSNPRFAWSDELSMEANNTSGFNYRPKAGTMDIPSQHAFGRAIDINPLWNPYIKKEIVLPRAATYEPERAGTITRQSFIVEFFERRGWTWGGRWKSLKDYQHFEKP